MTPDVRDNRDRHRYELWLDGQPVGVANYRVGADGTVAFTHTEVDPAHRGQGVAAQLVGAALDDVRATGRRAVPQCPYVVQYVRRHPEYADLVASE